MNQSSFSGITSGTTPQLTGFRIWELFQSGNVQEEGGQAYHRRAFVPAEKASDDAAGGARHRSKPVVTVPFQRLGAGREKRAQRLTSLSSKKTLAPHNRRKSSRCRGQRKEAQKSTVNGRQVRWGRVG